MKAEELRIGNLINIIGLVPTAVTASHIKAISEGDNQYKPIPLTEEWLLKFGFIEISSYPSYAKVYRYGNGDSMWIYSNGNCELRTPIIKDILYVHQLQNLFFALTGNELK